MKKILLISAALLALAGCVKDEMYKGPSNIDKVAFSPEAPTSIAPVSVTATVSGLQAVTSATLNYNGNSVPMNGSGSQFTATILDSRPHLTSSPTRLETLPQTGQNSNSTKSMVLELTRRNSLSFTTPATSLSNSLVSRSTRTKS